MAPKFWDLPEDIIEEICSLLPAKSLLRLKLVQKSWNVHIKSLVKNPKFVKKHLHNIITNTNNKNPITSTSESSSSFIFVSMDDEFDLHQRGITIRNHDLYVITQSPNHRFVRALDKLGLYARAHCDGVVCFAHLSGREFALTNPATGSLRLLGDPCFQNDGDIFPTLMVGFGHDPIADVYKVVVVFREVNGLGNFEAKVKTIGSYDNNGASSSSSSGWRGLDLPRKFNGYDMYVPNADTYSNGVQYWLVRLKSDQKILSFDMSDEKFRTIELPNIRGLEFGGVYNTSLAQWNNSVAAFFWSPNPWDANKSPIEMWVMSPSDDDECYWTKVVSIGPMIGVWWSPIALWNSGEELLISSYARGLFSYSLRDKKFRSLCTGEDMEVRVVSYFESLVSL